MKDSDVLVTGGTGSFGKTIVAELLKSSVSSVRVLSRDEAKQDDMRHQFADDRLTFITGDVRDLSTVESAMDGAHYVFHAAALKQVPNCELFPMEAIRTNVIGSDNVRRAALKVNPQAVVALSTDKACSPINTMGLTKGLMERLFLNERPSSTRFVCVRYGNVVGSRGSVVPLFLDMIARGRPLTVTNPFMTRFLLTLPDAVGMAIHAATTGLHGELWVKKMPAALVGDIARAVAPDGYPIAIVGARPGEKLHEVLVNEDEMRRAEDHGKHFVVGNKASELTGEYTSQNADRLDAVGLREMFLKAKVTL